MNKGVCNQADCCKTEFSCDSVSRSALWCDSFDKLSPTTGSGGCLGAVSECCRKEPAESVSLRELSRRRIGELSYCPKGMPVLNRHCSAGALGQVTWSLGH